MMRTPMPSLRKRLRPTRSCPMARSAVPMISSGMPEWILPWGVADFRAAASRIFSAMCSAIFLAVAADVGRARSADRICAIPSKSRWRRPFEALLRKFECRLCNTVNPATAAAPSRAVARSPAAVAVVRVRSAPSRVFSRYSRPAPNAGVGVKPFLILASSAAARGW